MDIDLYMEPQKILEVIKREFGHGYAEMTSWQQGFLCELIRKYNPQKILEIGVSAGGTTAVILNVLTILDSKAKFYSLDYAKHYYRDESRKTGFVASWARRYLNENQKVSWSHELLTGGGVCNYLDDIGGGIDFLILDTMHLCPGEILDFLACLPKLSDNAVVVMHDIAMHFETNRDAYATQLLLDTVVAEKIVGHDVYDNKHGYPNIGAFQITADTSKYIENVFSALNITWQYVPDELEKYREWYSRYYSKEMIDIFDKASANNIESLAREDDKEVYELANIARLVNEISGKRVYIYGNGKVGKRLHRILDEAGITVQGHVVSGGQDRNDNEISIDDLKIIDGEVIVIGVGRKLVPEVQKVLEDKGISEFLSLYK